MGIHKPIAFASLLITVLLGTASIGAPIGGNALSIDVTKTPFSKYGAWIAVLADSKSGPLTILNPHEHFGPDRTLALTFEANGKPVSYSIEGSPCVIDVKSEQGTARISVASDDSLVIETTGINPVFRFLVGRPLADREQQLSYPMPKASGAAGSYYEKRLAKGYSTYVYPIKCAYSDVDEQQFRVSCKDGASRVILQICLHAKNAYPAHDSVKDAAAAVSLEWDKFLKTLPKVPESRRNAAETAWYNIWSSFVRAEGVYEYDAVLMTKSFMTYVWSWDHCFNGLALARSNHQLAVQQLMLPFPLMTEEGYLPDMWCAPSEICWPAYKPPIHGGCLGRLREIKEIDEPTLRRLYAYLTRWTNFWMDHCDDDKDGVPNYVHNGCDSGWDNSTLFDQGAKIESPDLSAFLILQMDELSQVADKLGDKDAAKTWLKRKNKLKSDFYAHSWNTERFVAKMSGSHTFEEKPTSLLSLMPLVMGNELDKDKFDKLVAILKRDFLTENGLPSEMVTSPHYEPDGYWRGPIWAPSTYLIVDGLRRGGRPDLAKEIARRFCDMIQNKAGGNYENFDALTGKGLRAAGYTWTAAVNILLMEEYLSE